MTLLKQCGLRWDGNRDHKKRIVKNGNRKLIFSLFQWSDSTNSYSGKTKAFRFVVWNRSIPLSEISNFRLLFVISGTFLYFLSYHWELFSFLHVSLWKRPPYSIYQSVFMKSICTYLNSWNHKLPISSAFSVTKSSFESGLSTICKSMPWIKILLIPTLQVRDHLPESTLGSSINHDRQRQQKRRLTF